MQISCNSMIMSLQTYRNSCNNRGFTGYVYQYILSTFGNICHKLVVELLKMYVDFFYFLREHIEQLIHRTDTFELICYLYFLPFRIFTIRYNFNEIGH